MKLGTLLFAALMALSTAFGDTRTRALVTNCDNNIMHCFILLYEVNSTQWRFVRTVVYPFDGHSRVPVSGAYLNGVVYVVEWSGIDDRSLPEEERSSARILKYDLEGNYLGVFVDDIRDTSGKKVCRLEHLTISHDGQYIYTAQSFLAKSPANCCVFRFKVSDGSGGAIANGYSCVRGPVFETSDGKTIFVTDRNKTTSGNVFMYDVDGDTFTRRTKKYYHEMANVAFLDEDTQRLYVGGYNAGISVFDYSSTSTDPIGRMKKSATELNVTNTANCTKISKIGGEFYMASFDGRQILKIGNPESADLYSGALALQGPNQFDIAAGNHKMFVFYEFTETDPGVTEIAHYKFDEPANSVVFTNSISPKWPIRAMKVQSGASGVSGGAVYFHQSYAHGELEDSGQLLSGSSDYGIFMWMGTTGAPTSESYLLSNRMSGNNRGRFLLSFLDGRLKFFNSFSGQELTVKNDSSAALNDGKWHHVGVVKKGGDISIWQDGVKIATSTNNNKLGMDQFVNFTLGCSAEKRVGHLPAGSFIDELRIFDGAPSDADVAAIYNEYAATAAGLSAPSRPAVPTHDNSIASGYGTPILHSFSYEPPRVGLAVKVRTNGDWYVLAGLRDRPIGRFARDETWCLKKGSSSWNGSFQPYTCMGSLFECPADSTLYSFGRTSHDKGLLGTSVEYSNPTNGCDGRVGYCINSYSTKGRTLFLTNDVNRAILRIGNYEEADLISEQTLTPGTELVTGGRYVQSYFQKGKADRPGRVGLLSGAITASVGISDFQASPATVEAQGFAGPVFTNASGIVATLVPAGTNAQGVALVNLASRAAVGDSLAVDVYGIELPGADRPFAVRLDEKRGVWWAATTPGGTALCFYASRNLTDWTLATTVFTVSNTSTTRVGNPSFAIDGSNIALAFNLACPDGGPELRSLDDFNYVIVRKVANFRQYSPWPLGTVLLFR
ncbi:MAG: LamG domain-containing protein [Kiritimatiellae bacterium]|nr:LamG domain-containing protein [Kiritimatiellia bacterium]